MRLPLTGLFWGELMPRFQPRRAVENLIVNPQFLLAQEGISFAAMAAGDYVLDGFKYHKSGAMVHTGSQDTDHPAATGQLYDGYKCLKLDCTTADASLAASDICAVITYVEGYDALRCYEVPLVLTFWHCHTKTGTYCVSLSNSGSDRSIVKEYTQAAADTWEKTTLIITASPSAGTWDQSNGVGFRVAFALAAGSTYQTTAGAWNTGDFYTTSSQVNACDSTANDFKLAAVALYPGSRDLGFHAPAYADQLQRCERYFEKTYDLGTTPGSVTAGGSIQELSRDTTLLYSASQQFKTRKRTAPTVTLYEIFGTSGQVSIYTTGDSYSSSVNASADYISDYSYRLNGGGNLTADRVIKYHHIADARF